MNNTLDFEDTCKTDGNTKQMGIPQQRKLQQGASAWRNTLLAALIGVLAICALLLMGCSGSGETSEDNTMGDTDEVFAVNDVGTSEEADESSATADYARQILDSMTTEEKAAQLFMITPEQLTGIGVATQAGDTTKEALEAYPVGGLMYLDQNLIDADQTKEMLANTQSFAKYGLFLGVDEEGGPLVARVANNDGFSVEQLPAMAEIGESGDLELAYDAGTTIGNYLSDLGFNLDFAPVADVLTNPNNDVIGTRSFGSDAEVDAEMVSAEVKGLQEKGVVAVLKHFPGHGGTEGDSHETAVENTSTLDQLESTDFVPFEAGIEAGASCVMVGHISLPEVTGNDTPATLSSDIVTGLLRDEMGFDGVVITDAMNMGAITNYYSSAEAAVMAINAGCDVILTPSSFEEAYQGILDALEDGSLTEERLNESVYRILTCKIENNIISTQD